jgi:hypothetical protein
MPNEGSTALVRPALAGFSTWVHDGFVILINYRNGRVLQGIVLSFGDQLMRVAIKDSDDAAEFRLFNGCWVSEDCEVVRLEFATDGGSFDIKDDFLEAMLTAEAGLQPVRVM